MLKITTTCLAVIAFSACASSALADPCEGDLPTKQGTQFSGLVRYVVDGDGICLGQNDDPNTWIEVRFSDFDAPELNTKQGHVAKKIVEGALSGKEVTCVTSKGRTGRTKSHDRVLASCRSEGRSVVAILEELDTPTGGN